jgi:hypothetical protein
MAMTFSVSQKLSDVVRMVNRWNTLHGLRFESLAMEPEGAVWGAGKHCFVIAEHVTGSQTQFRLAPLRQPTDRLAQSAWNKLGRLCLKAKWVDDFQPTDETDDLFSAAEAMQFAGQLGWSECLESSPKDAAERFLAALKPQTATQRAKMEGRRRAKIKSRMKKRPKARNQLPIWFPKKVDVKERWQKAYKVICKKREEYAKLPESDTENPAPTLDDLRDAIARKLRKRYSTRTIEHIAQAGDKGWLK